MGNEWRGYTIDSAESFLLNAGAFYKNVAFDESTGEFSGTRLGATQGGGNFSAIPDIRSIPVDGAPINTIGLKVIDDWDINLTANLMEATAENFKLGLAAADIDTTTNAKFDIVSIRRNLNNETDYTNNIAWVGRRADNTPVIIVIDNVLSTSGITITMADKAEGVLPLTLQAHAPMDPDNNELGCRIYIQKVA